MTDKEYLRIAAIIFFIAGLFAGLFLGSLTTSERYDNEIRTDQIELKEDVAEIKEDKAIIDALARELLFQIEEIKADRKSLDELKIRLSKGEEVK